MILADKAPPPRGLGSRNGGGGASRVLTCKSAWLLRAFQGYNRLLLRHTFHNVHLDGDLAWLRGDGKTPLLLCVSHAAWWDLLLGFAIADLLPEWDSYAAMDSVQLARYPFLSKLGVIGVDRSRLAGVRDFVSTSRELLEAKPRALWITPQGEFASTDLRPVRFQPGIGFIARELSEFYVSTVVMDYEFWSESRPEAFLSLRPLERITSGPDFDRRAFVHSMEGKLESHLDALKSLRLQRDTALFTPLLTGSRASIPIYDTIRALSARLRGERFDPEHGAVKTPKWRKTAPREPR